MSVNIAAIDVGSNAIRLAIARVGTGGAIDLVHVAREPVRLGHDVFGTSRISPETIKSALTAFRRFRELLNKHSVSRFKAVATSAVREAENSDRFTSLVARRYGIDLAVIEPDEEARLVHLAVTDRVRLDGKVALLVDIGGGSVEISLATGSGIVSTDSFAMGSVRLLRILDQRGMSAKRFNQLVNRYIDTGRQRLKDELGTHRVQICIGTGGSVESIGELRRMLFNKNNASRVTSSELQSIDRRLRSMSVQERVSQFQLRPDRADVISPAATVLSRIVQNAGVHEVLIPRVGVRDGVLKDLVREILYQGKNLDRDQIVSSALQLGRKYSFNEQHGLAVCKIALQIFDQTQPMHGLDVEGRTLLEVASLLHDVGHFIEVSNHHKHTFYILQTGSIVGLSALQRLLVANIARYHRKSVPTLDHESFRSLSAKQRALVTTLVSILRVADAADRQHAESVQSVELTLKRARIVLRLKGKGDMLMAKWALEKRKDLFEEVFGELAIEEPHTVRVSHKSRA
jgi:exopolyphosphatase / guanosine-5'-triphosphate,3'-diphosphate pyrophosphatase